MSAAAAPPLAAAMAPGADAPAGTKGPPHGSETSVPDGSVASGGVGGAAAAAAGPLTFAADDLGGSEMSSNGGRGGGSGSTAASRDAVARALQHYFRERGRCVSLGDMLVVEVLGSQGGGTEDVGAIVTHGSSPSASRLMYFKVTDVRPTDSRLPLLISTEKTTLTLQGGLCRAPLPVGCDPGHGHSTATPGAASGRPPPPSLAESHTGPPRPWPSLLPPSLPPLPLLGCDPSAPLLRWPGPGLAGTPGPLLSSWRRVSEVLAPLLHPHTLHLDLPAATVLLYGPPGSGRRTAARAAAAALGLHFIAVSCHELQPPAGSADSSR
ncbi:hypothetical protein VaNZ11_006327, partial [Volvox africanus]